MRRGARGVRGKGSGALVMALALGVATVGAPARAGPPNADAGKQARGGVEPSMPHEGDPDALQRPSPGSAAETDHPAVPREPAPLEDDAAEGASAPAEAPVADPEVGVPITNPGAAVAEAVPEVDPDLLEEEEAPLEDDLGDDYDPRVDSPEALRARARIGGGGIVLGVGLLLGVGAVVLGSLDPCTDGAGNSCSEESRNRAAIAMAVPAAAIVAGGATLLGLGVRDQRRLRAQFGWSPRAQAMSFGLTGRF